VATLTKRDSDSEVCRRLAANLAAIMHRRGMSQEDLSKACGVSSAAVTNLLSLKHRPTICLVAKLATGLGVSVDRLLRPSLTARAPRSRRAARVS
jgi:transcriptional regulator with XRE-family HTH domain